MADCAEVLLLSSRCTMPYKRVLRSNARRASAKKIWQKGGNYKLQRCLCCWQCIAMTPSGIPDNFGLFHDLLTGGKTLF